eukprot:TRINITY_DN1420_c0_g1_i7.p1 TRINITY_DN1420_c0_g1~~TRINITY_DN1420_c0_g1_i7.p1  ORF type:complete len:286 (-),score=82.01 TRINITY_DN1420_c0_g1_i7:95-952(-)
MIRRPPRSTLSSSSAASDVYKRQVSTQSTGTRATNMSPVKCALFAALFVAFAVGHADVVKEEIDAHVPELAEQHADDQKPTSDDEMEQQPGSDDEMAQQESDDEMDQLPKGVTEAQFAQATDQEKAKFWGRRRRRWISTRRRFIRRRVISFRRRFISFRRRFGFRRRFISFRRRFFGFRRRSSLAQEQQSASDDEMAQQEQKSDDEMDQLPEGVTEKQLAQATDQEKAKFWGRRRSSLAQEESPESDDEMVQEKATWGSGNGRRRSIAKPRPSYCRINPKLPGCS